MAMIWTGWRKRFQWVILGILMISLIQSCFVIRQHSFQTETSGMMAPECRTVQHELGTSCIPRHPQRIVVMDQESLEILVALGLQPIATTIPNRVGAKTKILEGRVGAIANLGKEGWPNLEKLVQLKPDLIIGMFLGSQNYALLSQVAPTVSLDYSQTGWKKTLFQVADIVDRKSDAQTLLDAYNRRVETLRSALSKTVGSLKICVMRFYTDVHFTQFLNQNSFAVSVLEEVGVLSIPDLQRQQIQIPNSDYGYINTSLEHIDWLEADKLFISLDPGAETSFDVYASSPLWQTLKVVQNQQIFSVDSGHWIFGNILSANAILDDLFRYLVEENSS